MFETFLVTAQFVDDNVFRKFIGLISTTDYKSPMKKGDYVVCCGSAGFNNREWRYLRDLFTSRTFEGEKIWVVYPSFSYSISPHEWAFDTYPGVAYGDLWIQSSHCTPWPGYYRNNDKYPAARKLS